MNERKYNGAFRASNDITVHGGDIAAYVDSEGHVRHVIVGEVLQDGEADIEQWLDGEPGPGNVKWRMLRGISDEGQIAHHYAKPDKPAEPKPTRRKPFSEPWTASEAAEMAAALAQNVARFGNTTDEKMQKAIANACVTQAKQIHNWAVDQGKL